MIERPAVRAVMLTPTGRMLLMQAQEPASGFRVWFAPGGGLEAGESAEASLRREILEETGVELKAVGPLIWRRRHTFQWNSKMLSQREDFYLVPIDAFEPDFTTNPSETELMDFRQFKWWSVDEIRASGDVFAPRLLAEHLESLIEQGPPSEPVDVGV